MKLNEIKDNKGATHVVKTVGRGIGSGLGKTSGKGHKGQKARGVGKVRLGFEGGQNPLYRRMPKRGFTNIFKKNYFTINLEVLAAYIKKGTLNPKEIFTFEYLKQQKVCKGIYDGLKILGKGESQAISVEVAAISKTAKEAIEKAGGKVSVLTPKKFVVTKWQES